MKKALFFLAAGVIIFLISCSNDTGKKDISGNFTVGITDKPMTFCNPVNVSVGSERARRAGEPVVVLYKDDYYLFITGGRGYWYSGNFRDWTYVSAPDFPGGCPSVAVHGETMYASGDKGLHDVVASTDPKSGVWKKVGEYQRDYGDADMFIDDDGRFYMYWGWSQIMPVQVVELDPENGFREKGKPVVCFFGDYENHGFERRRNEDVIFSIFNHRTYFPEESPWIEGPWMIKHNGKYYLMYAAIGLEFASYSHGVYVAENPMGPFKYSPHNPLTFKTTGFMLGAGHGSNFHDKNGDLWTIAMVPTWYGGRGSSTIAVFPTAVDKDGIIHSNTAFSDYPQYYPGIKKDAVNNNFTGWMLLSHKKYVEVSSSIEGFGPSNAVDENMMTHWSASTGEPGEYMTIDLGKKCEIYAIQICFDQHDAKMRFGRGFGMGFSGSSLDRYQSFTVEVSPDNKTWSMLIDKSNNSVDSRFDYTELTEPVKARYVKLTNSFTPDSGKFAVKDLRIFGNPKEAKFTRVKNVNVVRNPEDKRDATLVWEPVKDADGYVVRYGIEPEKLYNNFMVYDANNLTIHSLNRDQDYYFEVEAFDSGTDYYRERTEKTMGRGTEIELLLEGKMIERKMIKEGVNEYVFDNITPGAYTLRHAFGPVLWRGELTKAELDGSEEKPSITAILSDLGVGTQVTGKMELKILPGKKAGKLVVILNYSK
ncbi:MAG: family 43 glycosylhydrolase [Bacteroidales bacterium]|nr:family 43 glycosylhydrolase [Bacteroidales bacterium]